MQDHGRWLSSLRKLPCGRASSFTKSNSELELIAVQANPAIQDHGGVAADVIGTRSLSGTAAGVAVPIPLPSTRRLSNSCRYHEHASSGAGLPSALLPPILNPLSTFAGPAGQDACSTAATEAADAATAAAGGGEGGSGLLASPDRLEDNHPLCDSRQSASSDSSSSICGSYQQGTEAAHQGGSSSSEGGLPGYRHQKGRRGKQAAAAGQCKTVAFAVDTTTFTIPAAAAGEAGNTPALPAQGVSGHGPAAAATAERGDGQLRMPFSMETSQESSSRSESEGGVESSTWIDPTGSNRAGPGRLPSSSNTTTISSSRRREGPLPKSGQEQLDKYLDYLLSQQHPHRFMYYPAWGLSDEGCLAVGEFLRRDSRIKVMTLSGNAIRDDGVEILADGLGQNNTLVSLDLSNNAFGNVGAISLAEALHKNTSLTELQLSNNRIGDEGAEALAAAVASCSLKKLQLAGNLVSAAEMKVVAHVLKTRTYRLPAREADAAKSRHLKKNSSLQFDIELTDNLEELHKSPQLQQLQLPPATAVAALTEASCVMESGLQMQTSHVLSELAASSSVTNRGAAPSARPPAAAAADQTDVEAASQADHAGSSSSSSIQQQQLTPRAGPAAGAAVGGREGQAAAPGSPLQAGSNTGLRIAGSTGPSTAGRRAAAAAAAVSGSSAAEPSLLLLLAHRIARLGYHVSIRCSLAAQEAAAAGIGAPAVAPETGEDGAGPAAAAAAVQAKAAAAGAAAIQGKAAEAVASGRNLQPPMRPLSHSYVRVIQPGELTAPVVVDPAFREQFEIPHPTARYRAVLDALPRVLVLLESRLWHVVELLAREMHAAFEEQGSTLPPWRGPGVVISKWLPSSFCDIPVDDEGSLGQLTVEYEAQVDKAVAGAAPV